MPKYPVRCVRKAMEGRVERAFNEKCKGVPLKMTHLVRVMNYGISLIREQGVNDDQLATAIEAYSRALSIEASEGKLDENANPYP